MLDKSSNERKPSRDSVSINERIKFPKIRLIDIAGEQLGIFTPKEALNLAQQEGLDLVLVSDKSDPPVCRILDYGKYKFTQEKRAREARKKQHTVTVKEVKMRYKIDEHDYKVRVNQATKFLHSGDKVKVTVNFRGREIQHSNLAIDLLNRLANDLNKLADIQQKPLKDGRNIIMLLSPKKIEN
nr:InfC [Madagascaria erythrocladioides]